MFLLDTLGRPLRNLRLSVTDRCNLRCEYCMPEEHYVWLPKEDVLTFEEISTLVDLFADLGVDKIRLTGGEPLLRRNLPALVRMLAGKPRIRDLAMTTNGVLLADHAGALKDAGLHRVTVSLDTLQRDRFIALTRLDAHDRVLEGIGAAAGLGFRSLKIDTVVIRGGNDDELAALIEYGRRLGAEVRFIEYMDVGGATHWSMDRVVSREEILQRLGQQYGPIVPQGEGSARPAGAGSPASSDGGARPAEAGLPAPSEGGSAPAERFALPDGTVFGIIASTTAPFCRSCDRSRLTADGMWYRCLYATHGTDLRRPLRGGAAAQQLRDLIAAAWTTRADRGAEVRLEAAHRTTFVPLGALRRDPHLEMHTRGG